MNASPAADIELKFSLGTTAHQREWEKTQREAARRASLSVSTVKRLERDGDFPRKVSISANRVGYLVSEIDA